VETINIGTGPDSGDGETTRSAMQKINANFTELDETKADKAETIFTITGTDPEIVADNGDIQIWELTANQSPTINLGNGRSITLHVTKGAYTLTWPEIVWVGGEEPELSDEDVSILTLWEVNGHTFGVMVGSVTLPTP
jgi:hypothetical protein